MAAIETSRTAPFGAITTYRVISAISNAINTIKLWNDARATRQALSKLTDRQLDDIGLSRSDVWNLGR